MLADMSTKSVNPLNSAKGRRYTNKEKEEILDFVDSYNAEHGRGGQSAATKKFKLSPLTISSWRKGKSRVPTGGIAGTGIPIGKKLAKLQQLHDEIVRLEKELAKLRAQFSSVKAGL